MHFDFLRNGNFIGGTLVVCASVLCNVSTNIQKHSHNMESLRPIEQQRSYVHRKMWWMGMLGVMSGAVMDFVALGIASQTLAVSLGGAFSLITNAAMSHLWNKETASATDYIGAILIVVGSFILACTSNVAKKYTLDELEHLFVKPVFVVSTLLQCVLIIMMLETVTQSRVHACLQFATKLPYKYMCQRQWWGLKRQCTKQVREAKKSNVLKQIRHGEEYIYAICSGAMGALSVLMGGCTSKVVMQLWTVDNKHVMHMIRPIPFLFLMGMLLCVIIQTHLLNRAMMLGDNISVIPVFNAAWTLCGVQSGVVFYNHGSVHLGGALLIITGVVFLTQHQCAL